MDYQMDAKWAFCEFGFGRRSRDAMSFLVWWEAQRGCGGFVDAWGGWCLALGELPAA
jgi:hypothetical protein